MKSFIFCRNNAVEAVKKGPTNLKRVKKGIKNRKGNLPRYFVNLCQTELEYSLFLTLGARM